MVAAPEYPVQTQAKLVPALCVLHNFIQTHDPEDLDLVDSAEVECRSPQRQPVIFHFHHLLRPRTVPSSTNGYDSYTLSCSVLLRSHSAPSYAALVSVAFPVPFHLVSILLSPFSILISAPLHLLD